LKPLAAATLLIVTHLSQAAVVATEYGRLRGEPADAAGDVTVYRAVPYALPPTGALRWHEPRSPVAWRGIRAASAAPPGCMQTMAPLGLPWTDEFRYHGAVSEDCLYLNLWTPAHSAADRLPVLVFIHGGGFTEGSASVPLYDGAALARKKLIVVTINYRLGAFGFLAHPALTQESEHHASGNYGLMDQVAALHWVHANIAAFGGDPNRVTIAGQSAGAMSAYLLTVSPSAKGLFQGAIIESGPGALAAFGIATGKAVTTTLEEAQQEGANFAHRLGATTALELRRLRAERLLTRLQEDGSVVSAADGKPVHFGPVVDGWFLPVDSDAAYAAGRQNDVPLLIGMMGDEPSAFPGYDAAKAKTTRAQGLRGLDELLAARAATSTHAAYAYYFEHGIPWPEHPQFAAFHSAELPYVFDNLAVLHRPWSAADRGLAVSASTYWAAFAATGAPSGESLPAWSAYRPGSLKFMVFALHPAMRTMAPAPALPQ
jgi:para-nitrobenzyl esterase